MSYLFIFPTYVKSQDFVPESMDEYTEQRLNNFFNILSNIKEHHQRNSKPSTNLTHLQQHHIKFFQQNKQFIILDANKNLGPCIIERKTYITSILQEHLKNSSNAYSSLTQDEAFNLLADLKTQFKAIAKRHEKSILPAEQQYFYHSMNKSTRIPQFYGLPKIHKKKTPMPFCPVVSQCGSYSAIISTFINYKLQQLTSSIPSYIHNSTELLNQLDNIKQLPPGCKLFTSDATSMYTNIGPIEGVNTFDYT
jgi:hypothetical protein